MPHISRKIQKALFLSALLSALFFVPPFSAWASGTTNKPEVIRVGFPQQTGLTKTDMNGQRNGYTYEYLMEIAQYTGWEYEFVELNGESLDADLTEMLSMLERGELDLIGGLRKTEAMEELFTYAGYHYGTSSATLWTLADNTEITPENYYYKENLRITVPQNANRQSGLLEHFCQANNLSPELVYLEEEGGQLEAIREDRADLAMGRDLSPVAGTKIIAKFSPEPFFFATTKGNNNIIAQLDSALLQIEGSNPNFSATTYNKYFSSDVSAELKFTKDELDYIAKQGVLRVGVFPDQSPIQSFDAATGVADGIMVDILAKVSERTGLKFSYFSDASAEGFNTLILDGTFDLLAGMEYDYELSRQYQMIMTQPVLSIPIVRVEAVMNSAQNNIFGVPQRMESLIQGDMPGTVQIIAFPTSPELLRSAIKGDIQAAYLESYVAQKLQKDNNYQTLFISAMPGKAAQVCFGVNRNHDIKLISIISKVMRSIPEPELSSIVYANTLSAEPMTLGHFIKLYPVRSITGIVFFLMIIILMLAFYLKHMNRLKNELVANKQRYLQLCELVGEVICEYDYARDQMTVTGANSSWLLTHSVYTQFCETYSGTGDSDQVEYLLKTLINERTTGDTHNLCELPNHEKHWLSITYEIAQNADQSPAFFICKIVDVDDTIREMEALTVRAQKDNLTGLYNFHTFQSLVCKCLAESQTAAKGVFIIMDVDYFKGVNDSFGHFEGDIVLKGVADALKSSLRSTDIIGRLGGDEFVAFSLNLTEPELIAKKCQTIMNRCALSSDKRKITVSMGIVQFHNAMNFELLYQRADENLYLVKERGRNGYEISSIE